MIYGKTNSSSGKSIEKILDQWFLAFPTPGPYSQTYGLETLVCPTYKGAAR